MNGYRAMINDRLLPTWKLALLWCKCKNRWIDLVYDIHIRGINKDLKAETCKLITGNVGRGGIRIPFMRTVSNDDCFRANNPEEYEYWEAVNTWVKWFSRYSIYMRDDIKVLPQSRFLKRWDIDTKLYKFIIKNIDLL